MTDINIEWLRNSLAKLTDRPIIYDIGCADLSDTILFKAKIPNSVCYAFECNNAWKDSNIAKAAQYGIIYNHIAMSNRNDMISFTPSSTFKNMPWNYSGSIYAPKKNDKFTWQESYMVESQTFEHFVETHDFPDFIHMDVQGAEHAVIEGMGQYRPSLIWCETREFSNYETHMTKEIFHNLMDNKNYKLLYDSSADSLYCQRMIPIESYV